MTSAVAVVLDMTFLLEQVDRTTGLAYTVDLECFFTPFPLRKDTIYVAVYSTHFSPKFFREKEGCTFYMGSTNSMSI